MRPLTFLLFCLSVFVGWENAFAEESGKVVTEPLEEMTEPFATGLDFRTFNPPKGHVSDQRNGEILSLFDEFLEAQGVHGDWSIRDFGILHHLILRDYRLAVSTSEKTDDEDERKLLEDYLLFETPVLEKMEQVRSGGGNSIDMEEACITAVQVLYSLFADQYLELYPQAAMPQGLRGKMEMGRQFFDGASVNAVPFVKDPKTRIVGMIGAGKEAGNLIDPRSPDQFVPKEEIATMTHAQVAGLDISSNNPTWHTHARMASGPPDTWGMIEQWLENEVTKEIGRDGDPAANLANFRYDIDRARQVLFWDKLKSSSTSPKIEVVDAFGKEWKMKWGEETIIEPSANRLHLLAGSKFSDLTYADIGGDSHILILPEASDEEAGSDDPMPSTLEKFLAAMAESEYEFNAEPFVLSSGTVTPDDNAQVLRQLPAGAKNEYGAGKLIGRTWIRFRSSMVEAKHDVFNGGGPVSTHTLFADQDRALRQSMIVSFWLEDTDVKEDNYRSIWIEDFAGKGGPQFLQWFHDPGSSLGGKVRSGEINKLGAEDGKGNFVWLGSGKKQLYSNAFQLFRPGAWDHVTYADHLSGARHVSRINVSQIEDAVKYSQAPDFYQACMVWRLAKRRDWIAEYMNLPLPDRGAGPPPNFSIPLTTRTERAAAARHYLIPISEIEKDLVRTGFLQTGGESANTTRPFTDRIVIDGIIQSYDDTVILGILRDYRYPAGFTKRMTRFDDGEDWKSKRFEWRR